MAKEKETQTIETEVITEVVGNPPKAKSGEVSSIEANAPRTREEELQKTVPNATPMAVPDVVKPTVVLGISGEEKVQVKPTKPGPFKIGPKFYRFTPGTVYDVPHYVKQVLSRANALSVI